MKRVFLFVLFTLAAAAALPQAALSGEMDKTTPAAHSREFEKMKGLVGVWEGKTDMGKGPETLRITYELTSAGNAVLERFAAGQPHEMITVYHDEDGKAAMTHYCSLGNRPHMELRKSGENFLEFALSEKNPGLSSRSEMHMHRLLITFDGKDGITQTWTVYDKGEKKADHTVKVTRVKS